MKKYLFVNPIIMFVLGIVIALPVSAAGLFNGSSFREMVHSIVSFINGTLIPIVVILGIVYFLWNMVHYVLNMSNEKEREQFKKYMINSVIGIFVMLSVWGIIGIATGIFFMGKPFVPQLPTGEGNQTQTP